MVPSCRQCERGGNDCYKKMRGPGCLRCAEWKIKCSAVEEQRKKKETEVEKEKTVKVKRPRKVEGSESGEGEKIGVLKRIAEALEGIMAGQQELIEAVGEATEEQRGIRLAMEVWMRRQEEKERRQEKGKGKEKKRSWMRKKQTKKKMEKKTGKETRIWKMGMGEKMKIIGWRTEMGLQPPPLSKNIM